MSSTIPRDVREFLDDYPDNPDDSSSSSNLLFYTNKLRCRPDNLYIDDVHEQWRGDYTKLEYKHGFIQWLFPIPEHGMNYEAQPLQRHEAETMKANASVIERVIRSYRLMLDFYGMRLEDDETGLIARCSQNYKERYRNLTLPPVVVQVLEAGYPLLYVGVAVGALVIYDHVITLALEIQLIWRCKATGATLIFFLNRYLLFIYAMSSILNVINWSTNVVSCRFIHNTSCAKTDQLRALLYNFANIALPLIVAVFSALRVYALAHTSSMRLVVALATLLLGVVPSGANLYYYTQQSYPVVVVLGNNTACNYTSNYSLILYKNSYSPNVSLTIIARTCALVSDLLVLIVTWLKTFKFYVRSKSSGVETPFFELLLKDGTLYFMVMLVLNILEIILNSRYDTSETQAAGNYAIYFLTPLSSILVSRFILNLRHLSVASSGVGDSLSQSASDSLEPDMDFAVGYITGHLGVTLDHTQLETEDSGTDRFESIDLKELQKEGDAVITEVSVGSRDIPV
ncbi:uncharacterized protein FIBRA_06283 [Fibroporia radiculosa]|uniref:Uncharacterized protein n=1 Tax=Fibroporia radiculosa TaxID=599839 RepID=J4HYV5_9APHY|nr:uncharacterized protein FIBRA_06283 [Fibroporia radiculosa]CCM04122.1 predicted protein [Fibroporia radiculosa]